MDPSMPPRADQTPPPPSPKQGGFARLIRNPIFTGVVGLLLGVGIGMSGAGDAEPTTAASSPAVSSAPTVSETTAPEPTEAPEPVGTLTKADVSLTLKTTERVCFGSAGCLVTVEVRLSVPDHVADNLDPDGTWDVTYQVSGDESGPIIGTFQVYGNGKYDVNEELVSTPSTNTPVAVKVTTVEKF